jgi:hypothetical protein
MIKYDTLKHVRMIENNLTFMKCELELCTESNKELCVHHPFFLSAVMMHDFFQMFSGMMKLGLALNNSRS